MNDHLKPGPPDIWQRMGQAIEAATTYEPDIAEAIVWRSAIRHAKKQLHRRGGRWTKGENRANAKLLDKDIQRIWELYSSGLGYKRIADIFDVSKSTIESVITGKTWTHL